MVPQAVIFDCDGTLVNSETLANEVFAGMLSLHGMNLTGHETLIRFRGRNLTDCLAEVESEIGRKLPAEFAGELRVRIEVVLRADLKAMPGALDLVSSLKLPMCVASGSPRNIIDLCLSITGLLPFFEGRIFSSYEVRSWKPDPGLFLHAARALGAEPSNCVVIEDSPSGIEAGINAGMRVFAFHPVPTGERVPEGVAVIQHLSQMKAMLGEAG
jgi:HAD superfamily hydrolase (TIGR01509 family)